MDASEQPPSFTSLPDLALTKILNHLSLEDTCNIAKANKALRNLVKHSHRFMLHCVYCFQHQPVADALCAVLPQNDQHGNPCTVYIDGKFPGLVMKPQSVVDANVSLSPMNDEKTVIKCTRSMQDTLPRTIELQVVHRPVHCSCGRDIGSFIVNVVPDQFSNRAPAWIQFAQACMVCCSWWCAATLLSSSWRLCSYSDTHTYMHVEIHKTPRMRFKDALFCMGMYLGCTMRFTGEFLCV